MEAGDILVTLHQNQAVLTDLHFVFTSKSETDGQRNHGPAFINLRRVANRARFMRELGEDLGEKVRHLRPDIIVGPETLGRTLAEFTAAHLDVDAAWCSIEETHSKKKAVFSEKLDFARLFKGKRVVIVDDLLTTGGSIRLVAAAVRAAGGIVVAAACVVRRTPDVYADRCDVPRLFVLAEVEGFEVFTRTECEDHGPCSRNEPIVRRPGHGWELEEEEPDHPIGFFSLHLD